MKRRSLRWLIVLMLGGYALVSTSASFAIGGVKTHPSKELFPFFTWSLFSWVPEVRHLYVVELTRLNGDTIDPPRKMETFPEFADRSTLAYKTVQDLGRSRGGNPTDRATFEARYLKGQSVDYRIVRYSFEPLVRWRSGQASSTWVVGQFSTVPAE